MELFKRATLNKFKYPSARGFLTTEQLWDVPLRSPRDDFNLDAIAQGINKRLKEADEESFVTASKDPEKSLLEAKLEVVKEVIAYKLGQEEAKKMAAKNTAEKRKLLALMERKQEAELDNLSIEEIQKRLDALS